MRNYSIRPATSADTVLLEEVDAGLGRYNDQAAPLHEVQSLACVAEDHAGNLLGGLVGRTWGRCAEVQQLWVTDAARGAGIGRALMQQFETAAQARGVTTFYLETWSFQARAFYEKCGYSVALEITGMGPGLAKYTLLKEQGLSSRPD